MDVNQLSAYLDLIKDRIWTISITEKDSKAIKEKVSRLSCELEVLEALADTRRWLWETRGSPKGSAKRSAAYKNRVEKMIEEVHGDGTSPELELKLKRLGCLDMETFMFVGASYTLLGIKKMAQGTFECLMDVASKYVLASALPSDWILRSEFKLAVAGGAKPGDFKRKYQGLEYIETPKRVRTEQTSYESIPEEWEKGSTTNSTGVKSGKNLGIETAFEVPRKVFERIWKEYGPGWKADLILTIPTEDRVASALHMIPREEAIMIGEQYKLRYLPLPTSV